MTDEKSTELDDLFAEMRMEKVSPSEALMSRVLADAEALQPSVAPVSRKRSKNVWGDFMELIGGWPALSGVAAAGVTGIWLGFAPPSGVDQLTADFFGETATVSLLDDFGGMLGEAADG